jgi:4-hydroxybenzoate polyprenyltransferase
MAWVLERFPPVTGVGFFVGYAVAALFARALVTGERPLRIGATDLLAFPAVWSFFFVLRVFDEHKDYELDCANHPDRALQRGLITLSHLKVLAAIAVALQLATCLWLDHAFGRVTIAWALALAWSLLMAKEFFASRWIAHRLVLYAFLHMLVMPFAYAWMAQVGARGHPLPAPVALIATAAFLGGFAFEIARKTKAPGDERPGVDSYTKRLGPGGAAAATSALVALYAAVMIVATWWVSDGITPYIAYSVISVFMLLAIASASQFARGPTAKRAKAVEGAAAGAVLFVFLAFLGALIARRGVSWQ